MTFRLSQSFGSAIAVFAGAAISSQGSATEAVIPFSGIITEANADASTLVGVSGSLLGYDITGSVSYDTDALGTLSSESSSTLSVWDSSDGSLGANAIHISETINGATFIFNGAYYNGLTLADGQGAYQYGTANQALEMTSDDANPYGIDAAQLNLVSYDPTADLMNSNLNPAGPFDTNAAAESNFYFSSSWDTSSLSADWAFQTTVPEPSTISLLGTAAATFAAARHRRRGAPCNALAS